MSAMSTWKKTKQKQGKASGKASGVSGGLDPALQPTLEQLQRAFGDNRHAIAAVREEARDLAFSLEKQLPCRGQECPGIESADAARDAGDEEALKDVMQWMCFYCRALMHVDEAVAILEQRADEVGLPEELPDPDDLAGDDCPVCKEMGLCHS